VVSYYFNENNLTKTEIENFVCGDNGNINYNNLNCNLIFINKLPNPISITAQYGFSDIISIAYIMKWSPLLPFFSKSTLREHERYIEKTLYEMQIPIFNAFWNELNKNYCIEDQGNTHDLPNSNEVQVIGE
jgi:hypothetical protein